MSIDKKTSQLASFPAANDTYLVDVHFNSSLQISLANPIGGDQTAGTLTFRAKAPYASSFEDISPINSIDIAAPVSFIIEKSPVVQLEVVLSGFAGTASDVQLALSDFV